MSENSSPARFHECGSCCHYLKNATKLNEGECHRYPPQVVAFPSMTPAGPGVMIKTVFPTVASNGKGCSEFDAAIET